MSNKTVLIKTSDNKGDEKKDDNKKKAPVEWLKSVYGVNLLSVDELNEIYDAVKYHGFDRESVINLLAEKVPDPKIAIEVILVCSLRGPQAAAQVKLRSGKTLQQLGIPASGAKGTDILSCQRISAATADIAAYYFKKLNVPKRLFNDPCPAFLQFPSAGAIKMPNDMRELHIEFSKKFSAIIGGVFNESIYNTMIQNAYLDDSLKLFDG